MTDLVARLTCYFKGHRWAIGWRDEHHGGWIKPHWRSSCYRCGASQLYAEYYPDAEYRWSLSSKFASE